MTPKREARLLDALREYASHQSWRCEYPSRYPWNPDCPCNLISTLTVLGMTEEVEQMREWAVANDPDRPMDAA